MYQDILDAVTRKLGELFPQCTIYTNPVEQGLEEPCFFVGFLEPSEKPMMGRRHYRKAGIYIQYLPQNPDQPSREIYDTADRLMDHMEFISLSNGDMLHGTNMNWKIALESSVLSFFVDYNHFVMKQAGQEADSMEAVGIQTQVKEERVNGYEERNNRKHTEV